MQTIYMDGEDLKNWLNGLNGFKWIKNVSKFDEDFIENYDENSSKGYILEVDVEYLKDLLNLRCDLPF